MATVLVTDTIDGDIIEVIDNGELKRIEVVLTEPVARQSVVATFPYIKFGEGTPRENALSNCRQFIERRFPYWNLGI